MKLEIFSDADTDLKPGMLLCSSHTGEIFLILRSIDDGVTDNRGFNLYEVLSKNELSLCWVKRNGSQSAFKVVQKENT